MSTGNARGLEHVAIAVKDLAAATALYRDTLGAQVSEPLPQPEHGVTVVFVELDNTKVELLEPLDVVLEGLAPGAGAAAAHAVGGLGEHRLQRADLDLVVVGLDAVHHRLAAERHAQVADL